VRRLLPRESLRDAESRQSQPTGESRDRKTCAIHTCCAQSSEVIGVGALEREASGESGEGGADAASGKGTREDGQDRPGEGAVQGSDRKSGTGQSAGQGCEGAREGARQGDGCRKTLPEAGTRADREGRSAVDRKGRTSSEACTRAQTAEEALRRHATVLREAA
jgi:hypothetical protein